MSVESLTSTNLDAARALAAAGCPVFPFDPETVKPCVEWTECSTTDSMALEALWRRYPDALPAIDLDKAGLLVIDLSYDGLRPFEQIVTAYGWDTSNVPPVLCPGGVHLYLRQSEDGPIETDASLRAHGIIIRGKRGYVIGPGAQFAHEGAWVSHKRPTLLAALAQHSVPEVPDWFAALVRRARALASGAPDGAAVPLADLLPRPPLPAMPAGGGNRRRDAAGEPDPAAWQRPDLSYLGSRRTPAPVFPLDALGESWGAWCAAHAQARGAPVDYVAGSLLAVTAALIGNRRWPHASGEWREPPVLWIGLVGTSASGKTPAQEPVLDLVRAIEREAAMRLLISGTTPAAIGPLLRQHPAGLLLHRDELSGWLGKLHRDAGDGGEREMWLASHGGQRYRLDRLKDPFPASVPHLTIGILGAIAPDKLAKVVHGAADELCARFLWCWPQPAPGSALTPARIDNAKQLRALRRILALEMTTMEDGACAPGRIGLSGAAAEVFEAFVRAIKASAPASYSGMGELLGKAPGHCLRLATTLSLLDWSVARAAGTPRIERAHVERAIRLLESYFLPMARRTFGEATIPVQEQNAMTLARWLREQRTASFNAREARRQIGGRLRMPVDMERACATLVEAGLIRPQPSRFGGSKGRLRHNFEINPAVQHFSFSSCQ